MWEPKHSKISIKSNTVKKIKEVPDIPEIGGWQKRKALKNDLTIKKPGKGGNGG